MGFDVLDIESEACFVPDSAYALLDMIVDKAIARLAPAERSGVGISPEARVQAIGKAVDDVLVTELNFGVFVPTKTLGDALVNRAKPGEPARYIFDCDTGSMILMTIADALKLPANLVEITLPSGSQHNYVRWPLKAGRVIDWDTNQPGMCMTPAGMPDFQGHALTRTEALGYVYRLRAEAWKKRGDYDRAVADDRRAMADWSANPTAFNNLAWLFVTTNWPGREALRGEVMALTNQAVALLRASGDPRFTHYDVANYLDTTACVHAAFGNFDQARSTEQTALDTLGDSDPQDNRAEFTKRLASFGPPAPKDCLGAK